MRGRARAGRHPVAQGDYKSPSKSQTATVRLRGCAAFHSERDVGVDRAHCTSENAAVCAGGDVRALTRARGRAAVGAEGVQRGDRDQTSTAEVRRQS